jgi:tetratricopeptide (TPR) repeat protein/peroxiredoxin
MGVKKSGAALTAAALLAASTPAQAKLSKGDPAPPFDLRAVSGASVSSQTLAQAGLAILTFVSLDSKPSRELAINLAALAKQREKGMTVVAVAADTADELKEFTARQGIGYEVCADPSKETLRRYGAENVVPITYLIAPGGTIAEIIPGGGAGVQQVLIAVADKEFARGSTASAGELYAQVAKNDPTSVPARAGLGFALARQGKLERAEQEFKSLESAGPDGATAASEGIAEVRLRQGDLDGALKQIAKVPPDSGFAHVVRGEVAARRGDLAEASHQFEAATAAKRTTLAWQQGVAFNNLANVSQQKGDATAAVEAYDKAIGAEPFLVEARSNKGVALQKAGRIDEAGKTLAAAAAIAPTDELVRTLLRRIEEQETARVDVEREKLQNQLVDELAEAYRSGKTPPAPGDDWSPRALAVSFLDFQNRLGPLSREGLDEAFLLALTRRLQESGRARVVEREIVDKLLSELKLGSSQLADPATRLKLGRVLAASVIATGGFYPNEARSELQLRLIDTETTDIRSTVSANLASPGEVATFADQVAQKILKTLQAEYPLKGKIASVEGNEIIVGFGRKHGARPGSRFRVVEDGEAVEVDGEVIGHKQKTIGTLEVTRVEDGFAYAKPVDGSGFRKDQHLVEAPSQ